MKFPELKLGMRVTLPEGAESYPDFMIGDALTGTVTEINDDCAWVTIDQPRPELAEWDNRIQIWRWSDDKPVSPTVEAAA